MKILICVTEYYPHGSGIANVAYNVTQQWKKMGHECTVCSPTGPDIVLGRSDLINKFGIMGILYYWYQVSIFLKNSNYDYVWISNPVFILSNPFQKCLITVHTTYSGKVKKRFCSNSMEIYNFISSVFEKNCHKHINKSVYYTTASEQVCSELEDIGIKKERISIIRNGVDTKIFVPFQDKKQLRKKLCLPENDILFLSVGRISKIKQPLCLIKIFSLIEKKINNVSLCVVGKGELLPNSKKEAKKLNIKKIFFQGYVDYLPELYGCADYYIMTSKYEGFPVTLPEAMASGLSCIVPNIPSLDLVKKVQCGITIDFFDISATADKIIDQILKFNDLDGRNARAYAVENLDWEIISKKYLNLMKMGAKFNGNFIGGNDEK